MFVGFWLTFPPVNAFARPRSSGCGIGGAFGSCIRSCLVPSLSQREQRCCPVPCDMPWPSSMSLERCFPSGSGKRWPSVCCRCGEHGASCCQQTPGSWLQLLVPVALNKHPASFLCSGCREVTLARAKGKGAAPRNLINLSLPLCGSRPSFPLGVGIYLRAWLSQRWLLNVTVDVPSAATLSPRLRILLLPPASMAGTELRTCPSSPGRDGAGRGGMAGLPGPLRGGLRTSSTIPTWAENSPPTWGQVRRLHPCPQESTEQEVALPEGSGTDAAPCLTRTLLSPAHATGQKHYGTAISSSKTPELLPGRYSKPRHCPVSGASRFCCLFYENDESVFKQQKPVFICVFLSE